MLPGVNDSSIRRRSLFASASVMSGPPMSARLADEPSPVGHELAAELADPTGAHAVLVRDIERPLPQHQVSDYAPVPLREGQQPGREIEPESDLFIRGRLGVVPQGV